MQATCLCWRFPSVNLGTCSHLRGSVVVRRGYVHNHYLFMSVVKSLLYFEAVKTGYVLAHESSRMAVYSTCVILITFKPSLSMRVFLQERLATRVHDEVATQYNVDTKFTLRECFSLLLLCSMFISVTLHCINIVSVFFPIPAPSLSTHGPSLKTMSVASPTYHLDNFITNRPISLYRNYTLVPRLRGINWTTEIASRMRDD